MAIKLGKRFPPKVDLRTLKIGNYLRTPLLPPLPETFDVDANLGGVPDNHMYLNDTYGDCVIAARAHMTLRFEKFEQKLIIAIADKEVSNEYFEETGGIDSGLYMLDSLNLWRQKGWIAARNNYKIYAFAAIDWSNHDQVKYCIMLLSGVYIGFEVPSSAIDQFNAGQIWDVVKNDGGIVGGHCVYTLAYQKITGFNDVGPVVSTWGQRQQMTWAFWDKYVDEAYAVIDSVNDWMNPATDPLDIAKLTNDLNNIIGGGPVMAQVTFSGNVSAQEMAGETVTISVTGDAPATIVTNTDAEGNFSVATQMSPGSYVAQASVAADTQFVAAQSNEVPFTIGLASRTVTLNVSLPAALKK